MKMDAFTRVEDEELEQIFEEAGRFAANEIEPTDRVGDQQGAILNPDGSVTLPESFHKAYKAYIEAGWGAAPFSPEWGGGGFPWVLGLGLSEMLTSANLAFSLCPMLTQGAIHMLDAHGSEEQKSFWLPKLISGEWAGTMNLTEAQAGSDVGALTTMAEPQSDGTYRIFGQKIFITYGEHSLTENIVHLVLARTPSAPPGTRGISCFIVPKYVPAADGTPGEKNDIKCLLLEKKMGIHASPTCVLEYGGADKGAVAYLIGEENEGMRYMFTMMNNARLGVGLEGLAISERVYQKSLSYAEQRLQGRRPEAEKGTQSSIIQHPDVKRNLLTIKSLTDAMRCLVYYNAAAIDKCSDSDPDRQQLAFERVHILTPMTKAWCTDMANYTASLGIQIHGGAGFIEETGIAQHYRDIRIAAIYEGTNGIQAIDLVMRKLTIRNGEAVAELLNEIAELKSEIDPELMDLMEPINSAVEAAGKSSKWLLENMGDSALAGAAPYLNLLSALVAGWQLARLANYALHSDQLSDKEKQNKIASARFFCLQILPTSTALEHSIMAGSQILSDYAP